jgi:diketogulonate reductase-like aldo/keto reductase
MKNEIIIGTWQIEDADVCRKSVTAALVAGYRHIDTAADYGNEESVGDAVRSCGIPREEIIVTTKLSAMIKDVPTARRAIDTSLKKLNISYVDQLLIHSPRPWGQPEAEHYYDENRELWRLMEEYVANGSVCHIGLSNFDVCDVDNILEIANIHPSANQIKCHVGNYPRTLADMCRKANIALMGYSTLCTNELIGREQLQTYADKYKTTIARLCIAFSQQHGFAPIVKSVNPQHIADNLAIDFTISAEDLRTLETLPDMCSTRYGAPQPYEGK